MKVLGWVMAVLWVAGSVRAETPYGRWEKGPSAADDYFPIAVWLQSPVNAERYKAIGINLYIGLHRGPTEKQLADLERAGMPVICHFSPEFKDRKVIVGWMHGDEPDNAQPLPRGQKGWGPPIAPEKIVEGYRRIKEGDATRPVFLNLGQGVAYDNYIGRGVRRGKLEDYPKYIEGSDVVSFDIYPVVHDRPEIAGNLWYVAKGVDRLREWSKGQKVVWNCIETTHIDNEKAKATPRQVRAEVWQAIIHGSRGLVYFAHEFKPKFVEAGLLADAEMSKAVGEINAEIRSLAKVINAPAESAVASVASEKAEVPVDVMGRRVGEETYVFAAAMRDRGTRAVFTLEGVREGEVEVIGEGRKIPVVGGKFSDEFEGYAVHLYRMKAR